MSMDTASFVQFNSVRFTEQLLQTRHNLWIMRKIEMNETRFQLSRDLYDRRNRLLDN